MVSARALLQLDPVGCSGVEMAPQRWSILRQRGHSFAPHVNHSVASGDGPRTVLQRGGAAVSISSQYSQQWDMGDVLEKMIWLGRSWTHDTR